MSTRADSPSVIPVTPSFLRGWELPGTGSGKNDRGSVLVIGGARRTVGAACLAGTAALRSGAGHLTLAVAESTAVAVAVALPEAGVLGLPETSSGSVSAAAIHALVPELDSADTILVGPGLDDPEETLGLVQALLRQAHPQEGRTVVIDAYALGILPRLQDESRPWAGHLILTPNPTEGGLLLERDLSELRADTAEMAERYGAVVSCQGVIAEPGASDPASSTNCWEITTGSGGLGTSGSGDILAGAIAGLRARGTTDAQAACWGTYLHAAAGDRLASRRGSPGYLARELADELPSLMLELST